MNLIECDPDFAKQVMEDALCDVEDMEVYSDEIGAFSPIWEHHLSHLTKFSIFLRTMAFL